MTEENKFFSFFKPKEKEKKKVVYDESYFNISTIGGHFISEPILVEGSTVDGQIVELQCSWFLISTTNDITKLDHTGSIYYPSPNDLGCRIMVQAVPVVAEYEGMPKSLEVGPLEVEPVQEEPSSPQKESEQSKKLQLQINTLTEQLSICTKNYYVIEAENVQQKKQIELLLDSKSFLQSDITLYKGQIAELQESISSLNEQIVDLQRKLNRSNANQQLNDAKAQIEQLKQEIIHRDLALEGAQQVQILANNRIKELENIIEEKDNQINHETKKYESLAQEIGMKQSPVQSQIQLSRASSSIILDDVRIQESQSCTHLELDQTEINKLRQYIQHLEATLRSMKMAYDQDVRKNTKSSPMKSTSTKDMKYLQSLANNMTEIITEKEMQLENQKNINKQLLAQILILQQR